MEKEKEVESEVLLLPDYYFSIEEMEQYGFTKGTMFPLHREKANVLYTLGLKIYILYSDNGEEEVWDTPDAFEQGTLFGIKKDEWLEFIKTDKGLIYIYAWNDVIDATQQVRIDVEMSLGEYTYDCYEEMYWGESAGIESFLDERYEQFGDTPKEICDKARDKTLLVKICYEYAERMREAFSELAGGKLTLADFLIKIIEEIVERRYGE